MKQRNTDIENRQKVTKMKINKKTEAEWKRERGEEIKGRDDV